MYLVCTNEKAQNGIIYSSSTAKTMKMEPKMSERKKKSISPLMK